MSLDRAQDDLNAPLEQTAVEAQADSTVIHLAAGTALGPYRIESLLGAGGMGQVYRARDTRLGRAVAIKIAGRQFSERFEREARAISSLNHPHICTLYDVGPNYLVMELVEGETLAARLRKGALPIGPALRCGVQIAKALEAAHEKGIVHRDLKPANVNVTPEGVVKVLDFGLAREEPANSGDPPVSVTHAGMIIGTAGYMSPEQAQGSTADRRADIWSFGAVLYELLAGKRAFQGQSLSDTLASVLKEEPDWSALPAQTPAAIRTLLQHCLRKDRKRRLQAIGDARIAIEDVLAEVTPAGEPAPAAGFRRSILPWVAAAGVLAIVAAIGWTAWRSARPVDNSLMRLSVDLGPDAIAGGHITAAISPDGTRLVFPVRGADGQTQLATRLLDQPKPTLLSGTEGADDPFFSPDGRWIGFFAAGKMKKVSVRDSAVVVLCDAPSGRGAAWGDDDNIIATLSGGSGVGLSRVPAAGGTPQAVTTPGSKGDATDRWPQILPGGRTVLFMANKAISRYDDSSIEVLSLKTGKVKVVQRGGYFGRYLPGGYLVYLRQRTLFGVPFDLDRLEVRGTPAPLLEDVAGDSNTAGGQFDFSRNGRFVYLSGKSSTGTWAMAWLDGAGNIQPLPPGPGVYYEPRFSPDGKRLAFSNGTDIEIYDWARETRTRLTFAAQAVNNRPVWTPDGKHIVFVSLGGTKSSLQWIRADGAGEAQPLLETRNELGPYSFSPDGTRVSFSEQNTETGSDLWMLPLDTIDPEHPRAGKPELFLRTPSSEQDAAFSPDGRWIAYSSTESGRSEVFVRPYPAGGPSGSGKWPVSTGGGQFPIWSRDGRQLFYEDPGNRIMAAAYTVKGDSFAVAKPRPWSTTPLLDIVGHWNLDIAPEGSRFVVTQGANAAGVPGGSLHVTFLLNFFDEVRRRIPAGK